MRNSLRTLLTLSVLAWFSGNAVAGTVVLDFESFANSVPTTETLIEDGFYMDPALASADPAIVLDSGSGVGNSLAFCGWCGPEQGISIYALSGVTFELDEFYTYTTNSGVGSYVYDGEIIGYLEGGGTVSRLFDTNAGTLLFDQSWTSLTSIDIVFTTDRIDSDFTIPAIDNITLQAVPVPAAAWLFGSALAGLGWLRRRRS